MAQNHHQYTIFLYRNSYRLHHSFQYWLIFPILSIYIVLLRSFFQLSLPLSLCLFIHPIFIVSKHFDISYVNTTRCKMDRFHVIYFSLAPLYRFGARDIVLCFHWEHKYIHTHTRTYFKVFSLYHFPNIEFL